MQSIEGVLPPLVLHEVDALRTFSDQGSPPGTRDESIDSPDQIFSSMEALAEPAFPAVGAREQPRCLWSDFEEMPRLQQL